MNDGCPTEDELDSIKKWDISDPKGLVEFLQENFWTPDWCIKVSKGRNCMKEWVMRIHISTAGWSGNEDRIRALKINWFWMIYWQTHRTGGHYMFEIPIKIWKKGFN